MPVASNRSLRVLLDDAFKGGSTEATPQPVDAVFSLAFLALHRHPIAHEDLNVSCGYLPPRKVVASL